MLPGAFDSYIGDALLDRASRASPSELFKHTIDANYFEKRDDTVLTEMALRSRKKEYKLIRIVQYIVDDVLQQQ
jgi:hypothetical protein